MWWLKNLIKYENSELFSINLRNLLKISNFSWLLMVINCLESYVQCVPYAWHQTDAWRRLDNCCQDNLASQIHRPTSSKKIYKDLPNSFNCNLSNAIRSHGKGQHIILRAERHLIVLVDVFKYGIITRFFLVNALIKDSIYSYLW